jgi:3-oxoacyl-(acyl-carrier-protein) synthase
MRHRLELEQLEEKHSPSRGASRPRDVSLWLKEIERPKSSQKMQTLGSRGTIKRMSGACSCPTSANAGS